MDKLTEFFKNNNVQIGKDFTSTTPVYYHSLEEGFEGYFNTFSTLRNKYDLLLDFKNHTRVFLAFNFLDEGNTVTTILGFHRFFELFFKDLLKRINPFLAVKFLPKAEQVVKYLNNELDPDEVNTIEYNESIERLKAILRGLKTAQNNKAVDVLGSFEFLLHDSAQNYLKQLADWRNRIMHNGNTIPNIFALDYLISQGIIPLVKKIIDIEKNNWNGYFPYYLLTPTGIKILDNILNVKFNYNDFSNQSKFEDLTLNFLFLAHLKELGRACKNYVPSLRGNVNFLAPYYENPIGQFERFAESERAHPDFYNLSSCPCCGNKTLVVYRKTVDPLVAWFKCYACDYSIKDNVGDPYSFGISASNIFPENNELNK